jgi:hypothetical protein
MSMPGTKVPKHLPDVLILGLFATWPFLRFVGHNYAQLTAQDLFELGVSSAAYVGAAFAPYLVALAVRRGDRFAVGIAAFTVCLFGYDLLRLVGVARGGGGTRPFRSSSGRRQRSSPSGSSPPRRARRF